MYQFDFKNPGKLYFAGIGGISMSAFAELLHTKGFHISGSDSHKSQISEHLESLGISIAYQQLADNITEDIDLVVYTAAIHADQAELSRARELGIPCISRAQMIGEVMKNYTNAISIAGTHGKTTTTSLVSDIFLSADLNPTISVGGILESIHGNLRIGGVENLILETCEYTNSFLEFFPTSAIILNIEEDHLDFFKDLKDIRNSFHTFCKRIPESGFVVMNADIENYNEITDDLSCKVITYSSKNIDADYSAASITYNEQGQAAFDVVYKGDTLGRIELHVPGAHNISNALSAIALAMQYDIPFEIIQKGIGTFHGTDRRFQLKGKKNGFTIIDDYAHHPTEVTVSLTTAQNYPHREIWCIFQPHTYTRTKIFKKEFAKALSLADHVVLAKIYAAREQDPGDISSDDIRKELVAMGQDAYYFETFSEIEEFVQKKCTHGDLLITMGAGDVVNIGEDLLSD